MTQKKRLVAIILLVSIACTIMAVVDAVIQPGYAVKSAVKILLFLLCPLVYGLYDREVKLKELFRLKKKGLGVAILLALGVYAVILLAYVLLKDIFDFSAIVGALDEGVGVSATNFVWVALYISLINSLLEEFFFRGFAFLTLKKVTTAKVAYCFSSLAFAAYHVAMMIGWFHIVVFLLAMAGLFVGGLIFNFLNDKNQTIYSSWLVHMFANFAINTVGFFLFGIL